jgi:hypothetical protein
MMSEDAFRQTFEQPPPSKVATLVDLIQKAKEREKKGRRISGKSDS